VDNLEKLIAAGVVPKDHTLTHEDQKTIHTLSESEVHSLVNLKQKLGDDFIQRNGKNIANCFL
jgi:hypothetical protein